MLEVGDSRITQRLIGPTTHIIDPMARLFFQDSSMPTCKLKCIADYHRMLHLHVPPLKDVDEMLQKIKERFNQTRAGDWILGAGGSVSQRRPDNSLTWWLPIIL